MRHASRLAVVLVVLSAISSIGMAQCGVAWSEQFASPQVFGGACMAVHDDGSGPALYIGISPAFPYSGYPVAYGVVRWRGPGSKVQSVGGHSALGSGVRAFAVFDDGSGPALYATGSFTSTGSIACNHIARWNGSVWLPLGAGLDGPGRALAVYDDGSGPALWVGGEFTTAGGLSSPRLAKWNGTAWSAVVTSMTPYGTMSPFVNSLAVFDSGSGARLYASGVFGSINGVATTCIASTNGSAWLSHDAGILASSWPPIEKIAVHDAGSGPALYAAGQFDVVGGSPVDNVARWDGSSWSGVGGGIAGGVVKTLTSWNTPMGPKLVVGGSYTFPGRTDFWDGTSWTSISGHGASAACAFDAGDGNRLYLVGDIAQTGFNQATVTDIFQCFEGQTWSTPASHGFRPYDEVRALAVHDDGSGPQLYATGNFPFADGNVVGYVARWNGTRWSPVGTGLPSSMVSSPPYQLVTIGSVPSGPFAGLYASLAGQTIKWDGTTWTNVDPYGMAALSCVGSFDLGNGPVLVGSGGFNIPPPYAVQGVASWTGTTWSLIGPAFGGAQSGGIAWALERFDDGSGPALYAAGDFGSIGGAPVNRVAKWNGAAWVPLGQGLTGADGVATSLEVFDDGTGPALYAAGSFTTAGGFPAANIAKWNGTAWSPLSTGLNGKVMSLVTFNDGNGSKLYAGGYFTTAGGVDASRVACWNGTSWSPVQSGVAILPFYIWTEPDVVARALAVYAPPGEDPSLFVGGRFNDAGGATSANFAALVPSRPRLSISQTGGVASGVVLTNSNLEIGAEYFNVFSAEPAPLGPGTGPYLGLYATSLDPLLAQISMPLEAPPFHYTTPVASISFGPYPVPPGVVIEGVCFRLNGTQVGCSSTNPRLSVQ